MPDSQAPQVQTSELPASPSEQSAAPPSPRNALLIVFLVMVIDLLGFGLVLPLLPRYGRYFLEPLYPGNARLQGAILGLLMASFSAMQFVFAPLWGRISDRVGRRPFLVLGLVGSVVFYALFGFASDWGEAEGRQALGLILLFVARLGAGIAGATVSIAQAVIADCTTPEKRSRGMALIGLAFGIGFTFGPMLGAGALAFGLGGPGYVASGFSFIALTLAVFLMPETWQPGRTVRHRGWFNISGIRLAMRTPTVGLLILCFFLCTLAFACFEPTLALLTADVLHYTEEANFWVFAYVGAVLMLAQGVLYQGLARLGVGETTFMLLGVVLMAVGLGSLGGMAAWTSRQQTADPSWLLTGFRAALTLAVTGFAFVNPSVSALISRRSDPTKQGEILGVNQSANALSRVLGPIAGVALYGLTPTHALPFGFSVSLLAVMLFLTLLVRRP